MYQHARLRSKRTILSPGRMPKRTSAAGQLTTCRNVQKKKPWALGANWRMIHDCISFAIAENVGKHFGISKFWDYNASHLGTYPMSNQARLTEFAEPLSTNAGTAVSGCVPHTTLRSALHRGVNIFSLLNVLSLGVVASRQCCVKYVHLSGKASQIANSKRERQS